MAVLVFLIVMLAGSVVALFSVPPLLLKIEPTGRVVVFGIPFL